MNVDTTETNDVVDNGSRYKERDQSSDGIADGPNLYSDLDNQRPKIAAIKLFFFLAVLGGTGSVTRMIVSLDATVAPVGDGAGDPGMVTSVASALAGGVGSEAGISPPAADRNGAND